MAYTDRVTIEPGKRGGKPCIRGTRITVYDVWQRARPRIADGQGTVTCRRRSAPGSFPPIYI